MLARMVWGTCAMKIEVLMGNCSIVESLFGQCPFEPGDNFRGASLKLPILTPTPDLDLVPNMFYNKLSQLYGYFMVRRLLGAPLFGTVMVKS